MHFTMSDGRESVLVLLGNLSMPVTAGNHDAELVCHWKVMGNNTLESASL